MTTSITDDRQAFEAWASEEHGAWLDKDSHGRYTIPAEESMWLGYKAALRSQGKGERCPYCDDTGDVHSIDGEWRGRCDCKADISADRNWIAGAQWGFGRGLENDNASLAQAIEVRRRDIREAKSLTAIIGEGD